MDANIDNQLIIRVIEGILDAEILLVKDNLTIEKEIPVTDIYKLFKNLGHEYKDNKSINVFELYKQNIICIKELGELTKYYVLFSQRKIKCTYKGKGYSIIHPNSIFVLYVDAEKVTKAEAYAIKEFQDKGTELFMYPLPNQLSGHFMCLGTVEREFINCEKSILNIVEANYTHENGRFKFEDDKKAGKKLFKWLASLETFPNDLLISAAKKLEDILEEN